MSKWFDGEVALITGGSSGIGRAAALAFAAHELFASLVPGPVWQRLLRATIAGFYGTFLFLPYAILPLAGAVVLAP
jgi:hypothetical protein